MLFTVQSAEHGLKLLKGVMNMKDRLLDLVISEELKCKTCGTRFHLSWKDFERMGKQELSILCPRCGHVVMKGKEVKKKAFEGVLE